MPVSPVEECEGVYLVDTMLNDTPGVCASFIIDRNRRMLIDAGSATTVDEIVKSLETLDIAPESIDIIVITHLHLDHAGGAATLAEVCENATFYCHPMTALFLTDEAKLEQLVERSRDAVGEMADAYDSNGTVPENRIETIEGEESLNLGDTVIDVLDSNGHAPHHFSLYDRAADALFVVDEGAVHIHGHSMPNASPPNFNLEATIESLERFQTYKSATLLYCHFGAIHEAKPQLEEDIHIVKEWVEKIEDAWERLGDEEAVIDEFLAEYDQDIENPTIQNALIMHVRGVLIYLQRRDEAQSS